MKKNGEMELTDKMIEEYADTSRYGNTVFTLATALQAERSKPKVWDGAPEWAYRAQAYWFDDVNGKAKHSESYHRTLPKTRAREIAEEGEEKYKHGFGAIRDVIEACIQKREAELKETGE